MAAALIVCGTVLRMRRRKSGDRLHHILAIFGWVSGAMTVIFIMHIRTGDLPTVFVLVNQGIWTLLFLFLTHYDLNRYKSTYPPQHQSRDEADDPDKLHAGENMVWNKIRSLVDENEGWKDPDLSLSTLSQKTFSNRTYVSDAFRRNTGMTFNRYIAQCRINYVVESLRRNPEADLQELFTEAGYRQRTTAWRNFTRIMGVSPTEFIHSRISGDQSAGSDIKLQI